MRQAQLLRKQAKQEAKQKKEKPTQDEPGKCAYPSMITKQEYFAACPGGRFRDKKFPPTKESLDRLLWMLSAGDRQGRILSSCNYFQFSGPERELWDPRFNARLAWEGFFTITTRTQSGGREPLPELQPFYGVLSWPNFEAAKHVRQTLQKIQREARGYLLSNNADPIRAWERLDAYQIGRHGSNWLTRQYFDMLCHAHADSSINFSLHCIEMFDSEARSTPLAGEIGFSIGQIYTSLSGWTGERNSSSVGIVQLVLLGRWLEREGYAFWSLGHCYSPMMDYKRQLGHRVYPRQDFMQLIKRYRGPFEIAGDDASRPGRFAKLQDGQTCHEANLLQVASAELQPLSFEAQSDSVAAKQETLPPHRKSSQSKVRSSCCVS